MDYWRPHGTVSVAGDIGGDIQAGEAYEKRFIHPKFAGRLVVVAVYPVFGDGSNPMPPDVTVISLQVQIEYMICRDVDDPGSTEEWADYRYMSVPLPAGSSLDQAQALCVPFLEAYNGTNIVWNGDML